VEVAVVTEHDMLGNLNIMKDRIVGKRTWEDCTSCYRQYREPSCAKRGNGAVGAGGGGTETFDLTGLAGRGDCVCG